MKKGPLLVSADRLQVAELGDLVEQHEHAVLRQSGGAEHGVDGGAGEEAEPAAKRRPPSAGHRVGQPAENLRE